MLRTLTAVVLAASLSACAGPIGDGETPPPAPTNSSEGETTTPEEVPVGETVDDPENAASENPEDPEVEETPEHTHGPCGDLTYEGVCDGDTMRWCRGGELREFDCSTEFEDRRGTCRFVEGLGADCAVTEGESCYNEDPLHYEFCGSDAPVCVHTPDGVNCEAGGTTCNGTEEPSCDGDMLFHECYLDQPIMVDCAAFGGRCGTEFGAVCMDIPAGQPCSDFYAFCEPGLICVHEDAVFEGICG